MKKLINQLLLIVALLGAAVSVSSCLGDLDNPTKTEEQLTPEQVLTAAQQEGATINVSFTYKGIDYKASFEKGEKDENEYKLIAFTSSQASTMAEALKLAGFTPYLNTRIPDDWTTEQFEQYLEELDKEEPGEGDDFEDEGDEDYDPDFYSDDDDDEGDDDDDEGDDDEPAGTRQGTRAVNSSMPLDYDLGLITSSNDDLVNVEIKTVTGEATVSGDTGFTINYISTKSRSRVVVLKTTYSREEKKIIKKVKLSADQKKCNRGDVIKLQASIICNKDFPFSSDIIKNLSWASNKPEIASLTFTNDLRKEPGSGSHNNYMLYSEAEVTGHRGGKATIYFYVNNKKATITITVNKINVDSVKINIDTISLCKDQKYQLVPTFFPDYATKKNLKWWSSNKQLARVNSKGVVSTNKNMATSQNTYAGDVYIYCTAKNGTSKESDDHTDSCKITVLNQFANGIPVKKVTVSPTKKTLKIGETLQLEATIIPVQATNQELIWASNKPEIATVDENGLVTAIRYGSAVITATTVDGGKVAKCSITVKYQESPSLDPSGGYEDGEDPTKP